MRDVTCHQVSDQRLAEALDDIHGRAFSHWHSLRYDSISPALIQAMADELLDHVAARAVADPGLDHQARVVAVTAAECVHGVLSVLCFPNGDQEIRFPLVGERISTDPDDDEFGDGPLTFRDVVKEAPTARTWLDLFEVAVVSGLVRDRERIVGLLLRGDYAPAVRDGSPYNPYTSVSAPADLAAMDALCRYLTEPAGHLPRDWPAVALRKPDTGERAESARRLDAIGEIGEIGEIGDALSADQRLLRVLLDDDQASFEEALAARLIAHRECLEAAAGDPAPRSLLPLGALALACLAVQVHGWELGVRSGYLPHGLLGTAGAGV
ncbi:immunity 49 family protein [Streptomyces sp. NBC_00663]|uniref:Imm49 family immunity protein n=1 Tax=Streptomyces sp. NBC_00663 TaxID=2975801 RepID=UPI002E3723CC|nr:Imm49 family immunity protein [Streptomyces sp. NBC_00663]